MRVLRDDQGKASLHALGIMKGNTPAFCGGFAEYDEMDENGYVTGRDVFVRNQAKEFFEEMVSGSVELIEPYLSEYNALKKKNAQIETEFKLRQVQDLNPEFIQRIEQRFAVGKETYVGPVNTSSRNTNTSWMETYLSWIYMDDAIWAGMRGGSPVFDYQLSAGDDADDVVAHRIDQALMEKASGTHSAMFAYMAASYLLDIQRMGQDVNSDIAQQLEELAIFLEAETSPSADHGQKYNTLAV